MSPLVSILVPSYNLGRFLPATLESIRTQTLQDFECIIGDDGSSEPIRDVVSDYLKDKRFSFIQWTPNRGAHPAIRFLYTQARGAYWCPFSSDDLYEPDFLAKRVEQMERYPMAGLVHGGTRIVDEEGREMSDQGLVFDLPAQMPGSLALELLVQHNFVTGPGAMLRASVARLVLPFYTPNWRYTQDWLMWILGAAMGFDFIWDPRPLVRYRMRAQSLNRPEQGLVPAASAEARLIPLWALSLAVQYSSDASRLWTRWKKTLYHLWLRRAIKLKMEGTLQPEWVQLAAQRYYGELNGETSLVREILRHQPSALVTWWKERGARSRQRLCVSGSALLDAPLFRK